MNFIIENPEKSGEFILSPEAQWGFNFINDFSEADDFESAEIFKPIQVAGHGCTKRGVFYSDSYLLFTSKTSYQNWRYYGGFEYEDDPEMFAARGENFYLYSDSCNRVKSTIDEQNSETEEE